MKTKKTRGFLRFLHCLLLFVVFQRFLLYLLFLLVFTQPFPGRPLARTLEMLRKPGIVERPKKCILSLPIPCSQHLYWSIGVLGRECSKSKISDVCFWALWMQKQIKTNGVSTFSAKYWKITGFIKFLSTLNAKTKDNQWFFNICSYI